MKYLRQLCLILLFSFLGEVCRFLIPAPIPASIYGMVLLFAALGLKLIRPEQVRDAGGFLTSLLPVLFVAPAVGLMEYWDQLKGNLLPLAVILVVTTVLVFAVGGIVTQLMMKRKEDKSHD